VVGEALGFLETTGFTPALVAIDVMEKTSGVRVLQAELNDFLGVCVKIGGSLAAVRAALDAGEQIARQMGGAPVVDCIARPQHQAERAIYSQREFNPLIQQDVVFIPSPTTATETPIHDITDGREPNMPQDKPNALGLIETQGFTAVFEAIDHACKAANVEVVGKEKLGGGYVTVIIRGDVAAVTAAIEAGKTRVGQLGKLIAAHVIPRPSDSVLSLLPKS
jgi:microcompartment protein CcmL/EutN